MVRLIESHEIGEVSLMGSTFFAEGGLKGNFVPEVFARKWGQLIDSGVGFVLGLFNEKHLIGVFGSIVAEDLNNTDLVANECFWFVKPEARGRGFALLLAYEEEAKRRGAVRCSMVHLKSLQPERLGSIYEKRGYIPTETAYLKTLI